jgi:hypothetical protein
VSLEAKQALNNTIIQNAQFQAARQTLGLSEPEMLSAVSRQQRRQARADQQFDPDQYLRQIAQSEKTTTTNVGRQELDGIKFLDDDENDAGFGQMQDDLQKFSADDRGYVEDEETGDLRRARLTDEKPVEMGEFTGIDTKRNSYTNKLFPAEYTREEPLGFVGQNAPKTALVDALNALNAGTSQYGYDAFPGSLDTASNLEQSIGGMAGGSMFTGPRSASGVRQGTYSVNKPIDLEAERSLASDLVIQDRSNYNPRMRAEHDEAVGHLADTIARLGYTVNGPGAMADEAIGRIGEIRRLGAAGSLGEMEQTQVIRQGPQGTFPNAEEIVDNTGRIVGYADPVTKAPIALDPALGISLSTQGANTPDTAQMMNSPQNPQTAREWTASNLPAMVQDTGSTPPRYPQANISKETTNFSNKLRELGIRIDSPALQQVSGNIRSIDELEKAATFVNQELERKGDTMFVMDPETRKNIPAGTQVVSGLMQKLGMTSGDEQRLANSMFQLDAARRSSVNQNPTGTYLDRTGGPTTGITFDSPQEGFGNVGIAQQKKGTRVKGTGEDVVAAMAKLQSPGAAKPYIGMPAQRSTNPLSTFGQQEVYNRTGETDPAAIRSKLEQLSEGRAKKTESRADAAIRRKRNESNIIGAQAVQRRADEDLTRRADAMSSIISQLPPVGRRSRFPRG